MEATQDNKDVLIGMISFELGFLKDYPGDARLGAYCEQILKFVRDWQTADQMLKKAGATKRWFPSPIELREIYCRFAEPVDGFDTETG